MGAVFETVAGVSISTGAVALVLLLCSPVFSRRFVAKWSYWIWLVLAVRLILPLRLTLPEPPVELTIPARTAVSLRVPAAQATAQALPAASAQASAAGVSLAELLAAVWLAGAACGLLYQMGRYAAFRRDCRRWGRRDRELEGALDGLRLQMGIRRPVTLLVCERAASPMMTGFFRPCLILPRETPPGRELEFVFRHELWHWKRHDLWYKLLLVLARAMHWFNPVVYFLFRAAAKDLELACDDEVARGLPPEERKAYAETIFAAACRAGRGSPALSTYFRSNGRTLRERFENLLGAPKRKGILAGAAAVLAIAAAGALVVCSREIPGVDLGDAKALGEDYLLAPFIGVLTVESWDSPEEMEADRFLTYYACARMEEDGDFWDDYESDEGGYVLLPEREVEAFIQSHFAVSRQFLRSMEYYDAQRNVYRFGGLGSTMDFTVTGVGHRGRTVTLRYDVVNAMGNPLGSGELVMEMRSAQNYVYRSSRFERAASFVLTYPMAIDIVVTDNTASMYSGGEGSVGGVSYDGGDLDSIVRFYLDEALPKLNARGSVVQGEQEGGWAWSGSCRGKPLTIDVAPVGEEYYITIVFDRGRARKIPPAGPILDTGWVNLYDMEAVTRAYVWPLIATGTVCRYRWDTPSAIKADDLIDICAYNNLLDLPTLPDGLSIFSGGEYAQPFAPARDVERALQKHFDVSTQYLRSASQYDPQAGTYRLGNGWGGGGQYVATGVSREGERLAIRVAMQPADGEAQDAGVLCVEIRGGVVRFLSMTP